MKTQLCQRWAPLNALTFGSEGNDVTLKNGGFEQRTIFQSTIFFFRSCSEYKCSTYKLHFPF